MLLGIAAVLFSGDMARAGQQILAAELLIVRDDIRRLATGTHLPPLHKQGLSDRIDGALGLLPWLLREAGDDVSGPVTPAQLDRLITRHPLDMTAFSGAVKPPQKREARAVHDTYCASCHDDAGQGDEDLALPARDLFAMAKEAPPQVFLARLINGVKGDETLLFTNPLSGDQLRALWRFYGDGR